MHRSPSAQRGSVLVTAAVFTGILSILVAGILANLGNAYVLNQQSHNWNQALHLAEAGVEMAFSELNFHHYQGAVGFQSARGWASTGTPGAFTKTVTNFTGHSGPIIGNVSLTLVNATSFNPAVLSVATVTNFNSRPSVTRAIYVTMRAATQFPVAMLSREWTDMNGNNIYVDSFDSTDLTKSNSGLYDPAKRQANGNLASNGTLRNTLNIGNADIYGIAYTGPGGSVALGPGGSVGPTFDSTLRATTVSAGQAAGYIQSDFNVDVPPVILPAGATSWSTIPGATGSGIGSLSKDATLNTGNYRVQNITLNSSARGDDLTINGNVKIYVQGDVDISGLGRVIINPGGSLTIYVAGNVQVAGRGIINSAGTAAKNIWYGLGNAASWSVSGNGQWIGGLYAPNANFTMNGGGASGDMVGSVIARNVTLNGQVKFHYDESLGRTDTGAGYSVASWQEYRQVNGAWVP